MQRLDVNMSMGLTEECNDEVSSSICVTNSGFFTPFRKTVNFVL